MPYSRPLLVTCLLYSSVYMSVPAFQFIHPLSYSLVTISLCSASVTPMFLVLAILTGVKCYLIVLLICLSWMISDIEQLFLYLSAIWISSLQKTSIQTLCQIFNWILCMFVCVCVCVFCCWVIWVPYIFWILTALSDSGLQIFFLFYSCHFILLMVSLLHRVF